MTYQDTPRDRLRAALDAAGDRATYVRVEVIDLRAYLSEHDRPDWVGKPDANGEVHCSRLAPKRCLYLEGHYGGCATP